MELTKNGDLLLLQGKPSPQLLADLKRIVPAGERVWRPEIGAWSINARHEKELREALAKDELTLSRPKTKQELAQEPKSVSEEFSERVGATSEKLRETLERPEANTRKRKDT